MREIYDVQGEVIGYRDEWNGAVKDPSGKVVGNVGAKPPIDIFWPITDRLRDDAAATLLHRHENGPTAGPIYAGVPARSYSDNSRLRFFARVSLVVSIVIFILTLSSAQNEGPVPGLLAFGLVVSLCGASLSLLVLAFKH